MLNTSNTTDMFAKVEFITPEIAKTLLSYSQLSGFNNRKLSKSYVLQLSEDMKSGFWRNTSQTIAIASNGAIIDGQHRLNAVVLSGIGQYFLVARNCDLNTFDKYDIGKRRSDSDIYYIKGYTKYTPIITSGAKNIFVYLYYGTLGLISSFKISKIKHAHYNNIVETYYDDLFDASKLYKSINPVLVTQSNLAAFYVITKFINKELSDDFMQKLKTGLNLAERDPVWALRTALLRKRIDKSIELRKDIEAKYLICTWNYFYRDRKIKALTEKFVGDMPLFFEGFDKIKFIESLNLPEQEYYNLIKSQIL